VKSKEVLFKTFSNFGKLDIGLFGKNGNIQYDQINKKPNI